jgi:cytochrome c oxidase assembly protein subunit 15
LVGLVFCQIALGAWTIWSNKAADVATLHVATGALIFGLTIAICAIAMRLRYPAGSGEAPHRVKASPVAISS